MKNIKRHALLIVEAVFLLVLFAFALILDSAFAFSLSWQFYLAMAFCALLVTLPSFLSPQRRQTWWIFFAFNASLCALHFVVLSPVKPFMQFQRDISNGMTIQQVQRLFVQRFPANGRFRQQNRG